jgi:hypothetical protein
VNLSLQQLAAHVGLALEKSREPALFAYAWSADWPVSDTLNAGGKVLPVRRCESVLAVREALGEIEKPAVLLVSCPETTLGVDVLGRIFRHRLLHVDRWQMVMERLGVKQVDPRLYAIPWMADALVGAAPERRLGAAGALAYDDALKMCLARVFKLGEFELDAAQLLDCCERQSAAWADQPADRRALFRQFLGEKLGGIAHALIGATETGNGPLVLAMGLVCEVLFHPAATGVAEIRDARVRLEPRLGGLRLSESDGARWSELATQIVRRREDSGRQDALRLAFALLRELGIESKASLSDHLPEALDQRLEALGDCLRNAMRSPAQSAEVEVAAKAVLAHRLVPTGHPGPDIARMVARLVRRLVDAAGSSPAGDPIADYLAHGAWEDWARRALRGARPESLARAVTKLLDRLAERRAEADQGFATRVAQAAAHDSMIPGLLPIESVLTQCVAPLTALHPIVWIVLDGMSWDVYLALAKTLSAHGWEAWKPLDAPISVLATVPSVTECSRTSLLTGSLQRGTATLEKKVFEAHPALKRHSRQDHPPVLLHKAEMDDGRQLAPEAARLLSDTKQSVVGIVINAIDDALAKSEQVRIDWELDSIPLLAAVMHQARLAGRVVILSSDHGHVLERQAEYRRHGESERWRPAAGEPGDGEIRVTGPRVRALVGTDVIVPWTESLRYAAKKNGYHGGATRQELLVPLGIWTAGVVLGDGYTQFLLQAPDWWHGDARARVEQPIARPARQTPQPDLFAAPRPTGWIESLLASATFERQREKMGRVAIDDARVRTLLVHIDAQGGRSSLEQLARAIEAPPLRMRGVISTLQRMLNVEGFPVVSMEQSTGAVTLDLALLKAQFEL